MGTNNNAMYVGDRRRGKSRYGRITSLVRGNVGHRCGVLAADAAGSMNPGPHSGVLANLWLRSIPGGRSGMTRALACASHTAAPHSSMILAATSAGSLLSPMSFSTCALGRRILTRTGVAPPPGGRKRGGGAAGKRGGGGRRGGVGGKRGEVGGGAACELERLETLAGPDVEVARPGAAHGTCGRAARERDEEVEPAAAERRVGGERARACAQELDLLGLEQLEARVVPQYVGRGRRGLDAEGGAVQLHHLGALALAPEAVPHCGLWRRGMGAVASLLPPLLCCDLRGGGFVCARGAGLRGAAAKEF
jgi:hypothetical protein